MTEKYKTCQHSTGRAYQTLVEVYPGCPLKPLPECHIVPEIATGYEIGYEEGWNECLEKIMRGAK